MISLTINGRTLEVPDHFTVLQAAEQAGIVIPTLCHHKDLTPYGGCRLCSVEIQGLRLPATACTMPVSPGMIVHTESPALTRYRRTILELLLVRFYDAGYTRSEGTPWPALDSQFAYWVNYYGIDMRKAMAREPFRQIDSDPNPYIWVDKNKCIMCTRCVRACAEVQGRFVWTQAYRGYDLRIVAGSDTTMLQARCESCGACVAHCPTGALDNKMSVRLGQPNRIVSTICSYCGVGCQLDLNIKDDVPGGRVLRVTSSARAPVNGDHLCVKGRYGYDFIHSPERLLRPRVRRYLLEGAPRPAEGRGPWVETDWNTALDLVANRLRAAAVEVGPESVGFLASGRCLNEDNYLLGKLARQALGTHNIDCCERLYHPRVVEGLEETLGLRAQSNSFDDIAAQARAILLIGSNTSEQHPVFATMLRRAVLRRGCRLIVAHPDFINMSEYAELRLVHRPGSDLALVCGLARIILDRGLENREFIARHTEGLEDFRRSLEPYDPATVAALTDVPVETLERAVDILAASRPAAVIWGVDLCRGGETRPTVAALAALQLLLGNFGLPGGGVNPLRPQCNSQGACDMGALPDFLPGYQSVTNAEARRSFESAWGAPLPAGPGLSAPEMIAAAAAGRLRALYILGEDIAPNAPESPRVRAALERCPFVVLQAPLLFESARYADVLLPGAVFAEKTGTFTSSERRVQLVRQAVNPPGEACADWQIIAGVARRVLAADGRVRAGAHAGWDYHDAAQVLAEAASLMLIYAGVSHERLENIARLQWPALGLDHPGTPVLGFGPFTRQKGRFLPVPALERV